jgi:hypothetical protein
VLAFGISLLPQLVMHPGFVRLLVTGAVSSVSIFLCIKFLGLTAYEQEKIEGIFMKLLSKLPIRLPVAKAN